MSLNTLEIIAIAVALIAFITVRQCMWQSVDTGKLMRMPVVFAILGVVSLVSSVQQLGSDWQPKPTDVVIIVVELGLGLLAGWLMGRFTQIQGYGEELKSRLAPLGIAVWLGFIALRIGLAVLGHSMHAQLAEQTGTVLIVVAVIKAVQAVMVRARIDRHHADSRIPAFANAR